MSIRLIALVAGASLTVAGCASDKSITGNPPATAIVRFVNATSTGMDVAVSGLVTTANTNRAFGDSTGCLTLNATTPALSFRVNGTATDIAGFTPSFTAGHKYTIVAIAGASATTFLTIDDAFTPTAGNAGLAAIHAAVGQAGAVDLHVSAPGDALSATTLVNGAVAFGTASAFANVTLAAPPVAQQLQFTTAGTTTVVRNHGNKTFVAGTLNHIILGPPAAGANTLRSIFLGGC